MKYLTTRNLGARTRCSVLTIVRTDWNNHINDQTPCGSSSDYSKKYLTFFGRFTLKSTRRIRLWENLKLGVFEIWNFAQKTFFAAIMSTSSSQGTDSTFISQEESLDLKILHEEKKCIHFTPSSRLIKWQILKNRIILLFI